MDRVIATRLLRLSDYNLQAYDGYSLVFLNFDGIGIDPKVFYPHCRAASLHTEENLSVALVAWAAPMRPHSLGRLPAEAL